MSCDTILTIWDGNSLTVLAHVIGRNQSAITQSSVGGTSTTSSGTWTTPTTTITLAAANGDILPGMTVSGTGIDANTTVSAISGTTLTISKNTTLSGSGVTLTFACDIIRRVVNLTDSAVVSASVTNLAKTAVIYNTLQTGSGWTLTDPAGFNLLDTIDGEILEVTADAEMRVEYQFDDAGGYQNVLVTQPFNVQNRI